MTDFNERQEQAVSHRDGPLLVLSGAGTGKTRVVVGRIARLIASGVNPRGILAITFTRKAADEMRARLAAECGDAAAPVTTATFHSFCLRQLRKYASYAGLSPDFTILDESSRMRILREALRETGLERLVSASDASQLISANKNALLDTDAWEKKELCKADGGKERVTYVKRMAEVCRRYEARKAEAGGLDFDDLLCAYYALLYKNTAVRAMCRDAFTHILVDEYQDTNVVQYRILHMLAQRSRNLCVVGDDDQAIYSWRGADVENILRFPEIFEGCAVVRLEQNYRSTQSILDAANAVIRHNARRMDKRLWTNGAKGEKPCVHVAEDAAAECAWVAGRIDALRKSGVKMGDVAVLFRMNAASAVMEEALAQKKICYNVPRDAGLYDLTEARRLLDMFAAPDPLVARDAPMAALTKLVADTGYFSRRRALEEAGLPLPPWAEAVDSLTEAASRFFRARSGAHLTDFATYIRAINAYRRDKSDDTVNLLTLHSAKGLEFRAVFMIALTDDVIPGDDPEHIEEERRLFYVGMTRARESLFLSWSRRGASANGRARDACAPSRFLGEIPAAMLTGESPLPPRVRAKSPAPKKAPDKKETPAFSAGDHVTHKKFGDGVVTDVGLFVSVRFADGRTRKFIRTAPMRRRNDP